jgi:hypothetical protein
MNWVVLMNTERMVDGGGLAEALPGQLGGVFGAVMVWPNGDLF